MEPGVGEELNHALPLGGRVGRLRAGSRVAAPLSPSICSETWRDDGGRRGSSKN